MMNTAGTQTFCDFCSRPTHRGECAPSPALTREALQRLDAAFNALWSNGPVIDTIADWGRTWTSDRDPAFYDLLAECRNAVRAALSETSAERPVVVGVVVTPTDRTVTTGPFRA